MLAASGAHFTLLDCALLSLLFRLAAEGGEEEPLFQMQPYSLVAAAPRSAETTFFFAPSLDASTSSTYQR